MLVGDFLGVVGQLAGCHDDDVMWSASLLPAMLLMYDVVCQLAGCHAVDEY